MNDSILDYARPQRRPFSPVRLLVWLMPLWSALIVGLHGVFGGGDDPYWYWAMALPLFSGIACLVMRERRLAIYCFATLAAVLVATTLVPYFNRAT
jgi:hypothetical membrane protein